MLHPYKFVLSKNKLNYQFTATSGNQYNAYFTSFYLTTIADEDVEIFSFGFNQVRSDDLPTKLDVRIKPTIQAIIVDFFKKNRNSAIIYICDQAGGKARQRSLTFTRWFTDMSEAYIKCDSHNKYEQYDFYSSIIIPNTNPAKGKLVDAFYYTLEYWMSE